MSKTRKEYQIRIDNEEGQSVAVYTCPTKKMALAWRTTQLGQFKKDHAEVGTFHVEVVEVLHQEVIDTRTHVDLEED